MYSLSNDLLIHLHCSVVRQRPVPIASVLVSDPLIFAENFFLVEISLSLYFFIFSTRFWLLATLKKSALKPTHARARPIRAEHFQRIFYRLKGARDSKLSESRFSFFVLLITFYFYLINHHLHFHLFILLINLERKLTLYSCERGWLLAVLDCDIIGWFGFRRGRLRNQS